MFPRTALTGLLAVAVAAIRPAAATATVAPSLAITQGNGATAGSTATTVLDVTFANKGGDAPKAITVTFPPGFLLNLGQNEGKCLASTAPSPSCLLGSITYTDAGGEEAGAGLYLVSPPTIGDVAGIALDNGTSTTLGTAAVTLITTPAVELKAEFPAFPTNKPEGGNNGGIIAAEVKLQSPRMPTACGAPLFFNLSTTTYNATTAATNALLEVTGCGALPYAPQIAATVTKVTGEEGADVAITLTQPNAEGEAATNSFEFGNPKGVKTNKVLAPCFKGATCTVGTVSASSPTLAPSELSSGELTLAGSIDTGNLAAEITGAVTMSFPPPFQFSVAGPINVSEHTITFLNLPDIPFSTLTYNFLGVPAGPAFVTSCEPSSTISATLSPEDGGPPVKVTGPVTNLNCPPPSMKPRASASLSGLVFGKPKLQIRATHDKSAPDLASLSIGLPSGLSFSRGALAPKQVCKGSAGHRKCKIGTSLSGLSLSGAAIKSAHLHGGRLVVVFKQPAASVSLTARGPLLRESSTLRHKANQHTPGNLPTQLRITDADGHATTLSAE
jgi:hypothetical protein